VVFCEGTGSTGVRAENGDAGLRAWTLRLGRLRWCADASGTFVDLVGPVEVRVVD
jgi:hypothetical protein